MNATGSSFYTDCKLDKLFYTLTSMFSLEGVIELGSRAAGSLPTYFEIANVLSDPAASSMTKGEIVGVAFSNLFDWKI